MIGEAVDTALTLARALIAWIAVLATVATIGLLAAAVTGAWAWRTAWRALHGAWRGREAPQGPSCGPRITRTPERAADGRTEIHVPTWAHTDKEAA